MATAPSTKAKQRTERSARKRDAEVLDAAARIFARQGYASASVQDVADELGILKGSLYHYIKTKEDLLFWLLEDVHAGVEAILHEVEADEELTPVERIELYVRRQVLFNLENLERISIYYRDMERLSAGRRSEIVSRHKTHERFIERQIRAAREAGLADDGVDPTVLANCVFGTLIWTYRWYKPDRRLSREAVAENCAKYAVAGIGIR